MKESEIDYANSTLSFPQKLFALLEHDHGNIISWASHGLCFRIRDTDTFAKEIIPKYFKQTKLTSFQRQLNLYGFRRLSRGADQGCYFHPKFQRDKKELLSEIKRLPIKGTLQTYDQVISSTSTSDKDKYLSQKRKLSTNDENGKASNHLYHVTRSSSNSAFNIKETPEIIPKSLSSEPTVSDPTPVPPSSSASSNPLNVPKVIPPPTALPQSNPMMFNYNHQIPFTSSAARSMAQTSNLPTMSKLTMNIGYGKNLISNLSSTPKPTMSSFGYNNPSYQAPMNVSDNNADDEFDFLELFGNNTIGESTSEDTIQVDYIPTFDEAMHLQSIEGSNF